MLIFGIVLVVVGYLCMTNGYQFWGVVMLIIGIKLLWNGLKGEKSTSAPKGKWAEQIANTQYQHTQDNSGIAINTTEKIVHFKNAGEIKSYPFSDIRSWRYNLSTGGQVNTYGNVGLVGASQVLGQNLRANRENKAASGFYVTVKDIENPEWRAAMRTEKDMKKWMEIFEQHVNQN